MTPFTIETGLHTFNMVKTGYVTVRLGLCFFTLVILSSLVLIDDLKLMPAWWFREEPAAETGSPHQKSAKRSPAMEFISCVICGGWLCALSYQFFVEQRLEGASFVIDQELPSHFVPTLVVAAFLLLIGAGLYFFRSLPRPWDRVSTGALVLGLSALFAVGTGILGQRWHDGFAAHYDNFFRTNVFSRLKQFDPKTTRIGAISHRSYPFFGSHRQFELVQAHSTAAQPHLLSDVRSFLELVAKHQPTHIASTAGAIPWTELAVEQSGGEQVFSQLLPKGKGGLWRVNYAALDRYLSQLRTQEAN